MSATKTHRSPKPAITAREPRPIRAEQRLLYDIPAAAFQLGGLSTREIKRRLTLPVAEGGLTPTRIGKRVFVSHTTLVAYIAEHTEAKA